MPIKNYTTKVPADRSINEIQTALVSRGAVGILYEYEKGTGRIAALKFRLPMKEQIVSFALPVNWRKFQRVLQLQNVSRSKDEDHVYRVAWRVIRDWVLAQLAIHETEMVDLPQLFLPYAMNGQGTTLYETINDGKFLLN